MIGFQLVRTYGRSLPIFLYLCSGRRYLVCCKTGIFVSLPPVILYVCQSVGSAFFIPASLCCQDLIFAFITSF